MSLRVSNFTLFAGRRALRPRVRALRKRRAHSPRCRGQNYPRRSIWQIFGEFGRPRGRRLSCEGPAALGSAADSFTQTRLRWATGSVLAGRASLRVGLRLADDSGCGAAESLADVRFVRRRVRFFAGGVSSEPEFLSGIRPIRRWQLCASVDAHGFHRDNPAPHSGAVLDNLSAPP
jgi:hypothetical protein